MEGFPHAAPGSGEQLPPPPEQITVEMPELKTNADGKQYSYEKDGVYYGGDYLPEPPESIDLSFPPAPEEKPPLV